MKTTNIISAEILVSQIKESQYKSPKLDDGDDESLVKMYSRWIKDGNVFSPVGDISVQDDLQKSAYKIKSTMTGIIFERVKPKTAELYKFKSGPMEEVLSEIDKFWGLKEDYKKLGIIYSRGILLYGDPGSGKTSIIHQVSEMIVSKGDVVFYASSISALTEGLKAFRSVEPDRRVVVILEDADEHVRYDEQKFLHLLDGQESVDGVVYIATTNYLNNFPPRLVRSGRFDKKIEVPQPPREGRLIYFKNKLEKHEMATEKEIEKLADDTDGMSFGDLQEIITAHFALKEPLKDVMKRLGKDIETDDIDKTEEKDKSEDTEEPIYSSKTSSKNILRTDMFTHFGINFDKLQKKLK